MLFCVSFFSYVLLQLVQDNLPACLEGREAFDFFGQIDRRRSSEISGIICMFIGFCSLINPLSGLDTVQTVILTL